MTLHTETQYLPHHTKQIFDLVADVEQYPQFLPWCVAARILERGEGYVVAELLIGYKQLRECYTSKVSLNPPAGDHEPCSIHVELISGPFHHLENKWIFTPDGQGTRADFHLEFQFRTKILEALIGAFYYKATQKMVQAFRDRAKALY